MKILFEESSEIDSGPFKVHDVAAAPSPLEPCVPVPAIVVIF